MKSEIERRSPSGVLDYLSLGITTFGVGYIPGAPGTYGSLLAVAFYAGLSALFGSFRYTPSVAPPEFTVAAIHAVILIAFVLFTLFGIWAAGRAVHLLGDGDPKQAVVDEVIGQLTVFLFIPFTRSWALIAAGFVLFRLFDIWKPYPIDHLQSLPGGVGVCADDILAGMYAGVVLSVIYAATLWL
jgi:phosphatidylglycerophosphatase A